MKSKFTTLLLLLILGILIMGTVVVGRYIYIDLFQNTTTETVYRFENNAVETPEETKPSIVETTYESISDKIESILKKNKNTTKDESINEIYLNNGNMISTYFYEQLNNNQKIIYRALSNNKDKLKYGNYIIEFENNFEDTLSKEGGKDILGDDYQSAIEAFLQDNPDLFYIDVNKMYLNIRTTTRILRTTYNVYISAGEKANYLSDDFSDTAQIEVAIAEVEEEKNRIQANLSGNDYDKVEYIHDYLLDNTTYDKTFKQRGCYSIYGALVGKTCVCEGYAKAFKYLANEAGIECEIMQGDATNKSGEIEKHAWNCVKLAGEWYLVDATWDDPIVVDYTGKEIIDVRPSREIRRKYFLKGSDTFYKDHKLSYQFTENGKVFSYPEICSNDF